MCLTKNCFNCLKPGHRSSDCKLKRSCGVNGCNQKHTKFLHPLGPKPVINSPTVRKNESSADCVQLESNCSATVHGRSRLALPIVAVRVRAPGGGPEMSTFALLDNGSMTTFCTNALADRIGVQGKKENMILNTIDQPGRQVVTQSMSLEIAKLNSGNSSFYSLTPGFTRMAIPCGQSHIAMYEDVCRFSHLQDIQLPNADTNEVSILIGQDHSDLLPFKVRRGDKVGMPYAVNTRLGWALNGALAVPGTCSESFVNFVDRPSLDEQLELLEN